MPAIKCDNVDLTPISTVRCTSQHILQIDGFPCIDSKYHFPYRKLIDAEKRIDMVY